MTIEATPARGRAWRVLASSQKWAAGAEAPIMLRIARAGRLVSQQLEETLDMSMPQMRILFEALEPAGVSQSMLHKHYQVDPASITRTVQAMERDGLVTRQSDLNDNRLMRVFATPKGRALAEALPPRIADFEQKLVEGLNEAEILQLHTLLEKVEAQLASLTHSD